MNELTQEQEAMLECLFDGRPIEKRIELIPSKLFVTIRNLSADDYLAVDRTIAGTDGNKLFVAQLYGVKKLARALLYYNNREFKSYEEAEQFILKQHQQVIDKLVQEQYKFELSVKELLNTENIEKTFFDQGDSRGKPEQSQKV